MHSVLTRLAILSGKRQAFLAYSERVRDLVTSQPGFRAVVFLNSRVRRTMLLALAALLALLVVTGGRDVSPAHAQAGNVTITKQLVDANGNAVAGDLAATALSGYVFTLTPTGGGAAQALPPTNSQGRTTAMVAVGTYTLGEQPRAGAVLVGFSSGGVPTANLTVTAGQTTTLTAQNRVAGTATIAFSAQLIDANGNRSAGDRSGFQFTVTGANGFNQTVTTDAISFAALDYLAAGTYTITAQPRPGFTFVSLAINSAAAANGDTVTLAAGQTATGFAVYRTGGAVVGPTESIPLFTGCNNVASTYPSGTTTSVLSSNISPTSSLKAIWFFINSQQRFVGFSPIPGAPNDLMTVNRSDPLFICMNSGGTFTRPTA